MRSALVKRVCTGRIREAPSSAAFSTMKSVRAFLIGANSSHRSGGICNGRVWAAQTRTPERRPASATSARHSPSTPLNTSTAAPAPSRITANR